MVWFIQHNIRWADSFVSAISMWVSACAKLCQEAGIHFCSMGVRWLMSQVNNSINCLKFFHNFLDPTIPHFSKMGNLSTIPLVAMSLHIHLLTPYVLNCAKRRYLNCNRTMAHDGTAMAGDVDPYENWTSPNDLSVLNRFLSICGWQQFRGGQITGHHVISLPIISHRSQYN
jgi:hypothetical protein